MHAETAYLFRHALLRDAAYQLHLPSERSALHLLALDIVEHTLAGNETAMEQAADELAQHARAALPQAGTRQSELKTSHVRYLMGAFRFAYKEYDRVAAARHLDELLALDYCSVKTRVEALRERGELARAAAQGRLAQSLLRDSLALGEKHKLRELVADAKYSLSVLLQDQSPGAESLRLLQECELEFTLLGLELKQLRARARLFLQNLSLSDVAAAKLTVEEMAGRLGKLGAHRDAARLWIMYANKQYDSGMLQESLELLAKAEPRARSCNDELALAVIEGQRGMCLKLLGDYDAALACHARAESHNRKAGEQLGIAINVSNSGNIHYRRAAYSQALACYKSALAIAEEHGAPANVCSCTMLIANVWREQGRDDLAESCYRHAIETGRKAGLVRETAAALENLGSFLQNSGRAEEGLALLREALSLGARCTPLQRAGITSAIGLNLLQTGNLEEAESKLMEAAEMFASLNLEATPQAAEAAANLALLARDRGDLVGARKWATRVASVYDRLDKTQLSRRTDMTHAIEEALALTSTG